MIRLAHTSHRNPTLLPLPRRLNLSRQYTNRFWPKMKLFLWCSIAALIGVILARFLFGQIDENRPLNSEPRVILIADHLHGEWLKIGRINHKEPGAEFNPNWSYIQLAEGIIPVVKKRGKVWVIQFDSEIAKELP